MLLSFLPAHCLKSPGSILAQYRYLECATEEDAPPIGPKFDKHKVSRCEKKAVAGTQRYRQLLPRIRDKPYYLLVFFPMLSFPPKQEHSYRIVNTGKLPHYCCDSLRGETHR